jgi:acetyl-CoA acetyltransferase
VSIQSTDCLRSKRATLDGRLKSEIHPLDGHEQDQIVRPDTTMEKLAKFQPVFDRSSTGTLTAGNSSSLTDGAAAVLLMSEERAKEENREPLALIKSFEFAAIDPKDGLLMAPGVAVPRLLRKTGLSLSDVDLVEMHEAFGGQIAPIFEHGSRGGKSRPLAALIGRN